MNHAKDLRSRRDYLFFALALIALLVVSFAQEARHRVSANAPADAPAALPADRLK